MKNPLKTITPDLLRTGRCLLALTVCALCTVQSAAQADPIQTGLARLAKTKNVGAGEKVGGVEQNEADFKTPQVKFPRKWNESRAQLRLAVENSEAIDLKIEGVQTSSGLYVVSFPKSIKAGGSGEVVVLYAARSGANGDVDLIRLLTNQGEKAIEVMHDREQVYSFDVQGLEWVAGAEASTKTITLTLHQAAISPKSVRVLGVPGHKVEIRETGPRQYALDITPGSTAQPGRFAVMVELDPEVRGVMPIIQCSINAAN